LRKFRRGGDRAETGNAHQPACRFILLGHLRDRSVEPCNRLVEVSQFGLTGPNFGIVSAIGRVGLDRLLTILADTDDGRVPAEARASLECWRCS
jgi:hypothetical protein